MDSGRHRSVLVPQTKFLNHMGRRIFIQYQVLGVPGSEQILPCSTAYVCVCFPGILSYHRPNGRLGSQI